MIELQQFIVAALGSVLLIGAAAMLAALLLLSLVALVINAIPE